MRDGYQLKKSYEAAHFRLLSYITAKVNSTSKKFPSLKEFWPIPLVDNNGEDEEQEVDRIKKVLKRYKEGKLYNK